MRVKPINLRLYRRFDADLIALNEHIPVNVVIEALLDAYAKGKTDADYSGKMLTIQYRQQERHSSDRYGPF